MNLYGLPGLGIHHSAVLQCDRSGPWVSRSELQIGWRDERTQEHKEIVKKMSSVQLKNKQDNVTEWCRWCFSVFHFLVAGWYPDLQEPWKTAGLKYFRGQPSPWRILENLRIPTLTPAMAFLLCALGCVPCWKQDTLATDFYCLLLLFPFLWSTFKLRSLLKCCYERIRRVAL